MPQETATHEMSSQAHGDEHNHGGSMSIITVEACLVPFCVGQLFLPTLVPLCITHRVSSMVLLGNSQVSLYS